MFRHAALCFLCVFSLLLISMSGRNCDAQGKQQQKKNPSPQQPTAYNYSVILDASQVVGGKKVDGRVMALEINDRKDIAILVYVGYGLDAGIWIKKHDQLAGAWLAYPGQHIIYGGYQATIGETGQPSLSPSGNVRYRATFASVGSTIDGYFSNERLIYQRNAQPLDFLRDGIFTPDDKVVLSAISIASPSDTINGSHTLNGLPTNLFPPNSIGTMNQTTGHTASIRTIMAKLKNNHYEIYRNAEVMKSFDSAPLPQFSIFINARDQICYSIVGSNGFDGVYLDKKLVRREGRELIGFNDKQEMMFSEGGAGGDLKVNDMLVASGTYFGRHSLPVLKGYGEFRIFYAKPVLNSNGDVLFAGNFYDKNNTRRFCVILATPANLKPDEEVLFRKVLTHPFKRDTIGVD